MALHTTFYLMCLSLFSLSESVSIYKNCGGWLTAPKGIIQSPNFPKEFPTPIQCEWVISNPVTRKTVLYLTQFYLKGFVSVWQYDVYSNQGEYIGEKELATLRLCELNHISCGEVNYITVNKPYAVIRFAVSDIFDTNVRVLDHLIDVYGFNITYEFIGHTSPHIRRTCSVSGCSYLGNCFASADYSEYRCHCAEGYFGEICQYGPFCDPANGINVCQNGGECTYFYGKYLNSCNCTKGFTGNLCDIPKSALLPDACSYLGCEQTCTNTRLGDQRCACYNGFRLDSNNRTCSHIDRNRIIVAMQPTEEYMTTISGAQKEPKLTTSSMEKLIEDVKLTLQDNNIHTLGSLTVEGFRVTKPTELVLNFDIETTDQNKIAGFQNSIVKRGVIGDVMFLNGSFTVTSVPELYVIDVVTTEEGSDSFNGQEYIGYTVEGKFLTISCLARGSGHTSFRWFKDGMLVDLDKSFREGYQTVIKSPREGTIRSVLYYDKVTTYDRGEYTCEASDNGRTMNKSDLVDVITTPLVEIHPMTDYVPFHGSIRIRCLSFDETQDTFQYDWFENDIFIRRRHDMITEKITPAGSQLYIRYLDQTTVFTCRVTNAAGSVNVTSNIFVQPANRENETCPREFYKNVSWPETAGGHHGKERCPAEAEDFSNYMPIDTGFTTRRCVCASTTKRTCRWAEPNFSKCRSIKLVLISDEFEILRLGYQATTLKKVFDLLYDFITKKKHTLFSGDVDMASDLLSRLLRHLIKFPLFSSLDEKIQYISVVHLLDEFITETSKMTAEEKLGVSVGEHILDTINLLMTRDLYSQLEFTPNIYMKSSNIDVNDDKIIKGLSSPKVKGFGLNKQIKYNTDNQLMAFTLRNLDDLFPKSIIRSYNTMTDLYVVYPVISNESASAQQKKSAFDLKIPFDTMVAYDSYSKFECHSLRKSQRTGIRYSWENSSCTYLSNDVRFVTCECTLPVRLSIIGIQQNATMDQESSIDNISTILLIFCIIPMCGLIATLLLIVVQWRHLVGEEYVIHLNFLASLIGTNMIFILCLSKSEIQIVCVIGKALLYLFYMAAFGYLFLDTFHSFIVTSRKKGLSKHYFKYMMIGWGLPVIMTAIFVVVSEVSDYPHTASQLCWIQKSHWQFYTFAIPVAFIIIAFFVCGGLVLKSYISFPEEPAISFKRKKALDCSKSLVLLVILAADSFLCMDVTSHVEIVHLIFVLICKICMVIAVFIVRAILDTQMLMKVWKCVPEEKNYSSETAEANNKTDDSLKVCCCFYHPAREQDRANKYYAEVNRTKYTPERKRQLSSLLGSSASGQITYPNKSPPDKLSLNHVTNSNIESEENFSWKALSDHKDSRSPANVYIQANGCNKVMFHNEKFAKIKNLKNDNIVENPINSAIEQSSSRREHICAHNPQTHAKKNGYKRDVLPKTGAIEGTEPEELTVLLHSSGDDEIHKHM